MKELHELTGRNKYRWTKEVVGKDYICSLDRKPDPKVEICLLVLFLYLVLSSLLAILPLSSLQHSPSSSLSPVLLKFDTQSMLLELNLHVNRMS